MQITILIVLGVFAWSFSLGQSIDEVIITEFMADPSAVSDTNGEWVELYNTTNQTIELFGWVLRDNDLNHHTMDSIQIKPHSYLILARNSDYSSNGGLVADYEYSGFQLNNMEDEIILQYDSLIINQVAYGSDISPGKSKAFSARQLNVNSNTDLNNWCDGVQQYGAGDFGSPGAMNLSCEIHSGEIIITEIMKDPKLVFDVDGEWIELYNPNPWVCNLNGLEISDYGGDHHLIEEDLAIPGHGRIVLARNADSLLNGGLMPDYAYEGIILSNLEDELILKMDTLIIDQVIYDAAYPKTEGKSMNLDPEYRSADFNDQSIYWCNSDTVFGAGDKGTPGLENLGCHPLPIKLENWSIRLEKDHVILNWKTLEEIDHWKFEILKSPDLVHFNSIGIIEHETSYPEGYYYEFRDNDPYKGDNYYQLIQYDLDGSRSNIQILSAKYHPHATNVYPNPTEGHFFIPQYDPKAEIQLFNGLGDLISIHPDPAGKVDISNCQGGLYYLIISGNTIEKQVLIKK